MKYPDREWNLRFGAVAGWALVLAGCSVEVRVGDPTPEDVETRLGRLSPAELPRTTPDVTNAYADHPAAAALGHKLFFDPRFSGPLLDDDNNGSPETLGMQGEAGRVSCAGCHVPSAGFLDNRSTRRQISLAAGWTRRRTPSLLDFGLRNVLMWDGRRDTAFNQLFGVIENPLEFNSSRLFVAQQIAQHYRAEYEAVFGTFPSLEGQVAIAPADAGCSVMPEDQINGRCVKPGHDDENVIEILVNAGKAIGAYERLLTCGPSRFDAWMHGDTTALTEEEQAGARKFVEVGCDSCHSGPNFSDDKFHNIGAGNVVANFVEPYDDPGAVAGIQGALTDPLNSRGRYSDGDDGRLEHFPRDLEQLRGAFRTPSLRCVAKRPTFFHAGQVRSLADVMLFFDQGGDTSGFQGVKDERMVPLGLTPEERRQIIAFLRSLDGAGPDPSLLVEPQLPGL